MRSRISIRVPEVYAWDSDSSNPVGAEYIIMEKICGVALAEKWESMNSLQRYEIINQIVKMEKEFRSLKLPAYGRLFLRDSLPPEYHRYPLPSDLDPDELFCIGPSNSRLLCHDKLPEVSQSIVGPCESNSMLLTRRMFCYLILLRGYNFGFCTIYTAERTSPNCYGEGQNSIPS